MISSSCNGCRVLRKGCGENCLLRQSLTFIDSPYSQCNATVFVSKFFGRSSLFYLLESAPPALHPVVFRSLLYEACDRTINPVSGVIGLLFTGKWNLCESAVDIVLKGGVLKPLPEFITRFSPENSNSGEDSELQLNLSSRSFGDVEGDLSLDLDLWLTTTTSRVVSPRMDRMKRKKSRCLELEMSGTTSCESGSSAEVEEFDVVDLSLSL
ncbi:LOB domain-containing protein 38-like [Chenopodium quinoa]|uniref:LOB domain-containing protein n=1 Tax=Chenopodium quinoa TaxID=63459 RepID=A0A803M2Q0_CHEQI|nr:LOB domain-containing protein 38-like [Chenopodium quinoa]